MSLNDYLSNAKEIETPAYYLDLEVFNSRVVDVFSVLGGGYSTNIFYKKQSLYY